MKPKMIKSTGTSFWSSLPGLITATATLIGAATAFVTTIYPMAQAYLDGSEVIPMKDFLKRTVLEEGKYRVRAGSDLLSISVDDVSIARSTVFLTVGIAGQPGKAVQVVPERPMPVVMGAREYVLQVHDLADVKFGADTAVLSIAPR